MYICANGLCRGWHLTQAQLGSLHFAKVHLVSRHVFISYLFHAKFLSLGSAQVYIYIYILMSCTCIMTHLQDNIYVCFCFVFQTEIYGYFSRPVDWPVV